RGERTQGQGFAVQLVRWWRMRHGTQLSGRRAPSRTLQPSVIMVAVDTEHPEDERHSPLRSATAQIVSLDPTYRLMCVSVIRSAPIGEGEQEAETTTGKHIEHRARLRYWVASLNLPPSRISLHVVEAV